LLRRSAVFSTCRSASCDPFHVCERDCFACPLPKAARAATLRSDSIFTTSQPAQIAVESV
jgi:hypothetical protein